MVSVFLSILFSMNTYAALYEYRVCDSYRVFVPVISEDERHAFKTQLPFSYEASSEELLSLEVKKFKNPNKFAVKGHWVRRTLDGIWYHVGVRTLNHIALYSEEAERCLREELEVYDVEVIDHYEVKLRDSKGRVCTEVVSHHAILDPGNAYRQPESDLRVKFHNRKCKRKKANE